MQTIEQILRDKLLPWSENASERIIVAQDKMVSSNMPQSVRLEKRQLKGTRIVVKGDRSYENKRTVLALWPDSSLNEVKTLKLACIVAGACDFQLGKQAVLCGPGHMIVIPPETPHPDGTQNLTDIQKDTFCEILYFRLFPSALQCWTHRYQTKTPQHSSNFSILFQNNNLLQQFLIFMREAISHPNRRTTQEKLFQVFILLLSENVKDGLFMETVTGEINAMQGEPPDDESFTHELAHYIQTHLRESPNLQTAANAVYLSRTQFARKVHEETGKTYNELVREQRLKTAKVLLKNTEWSIKEIATFLGYTTPDYFYIMFRQNTGLTPSNYRKSVQKEKGR